MPSSQGQNRRFRLVISDGAERADAMLAAQNIAVRTNSVATDVVAASTTHLVHILLPTLSMYTIHYVPVHAAPPPHHARHVRHHRQRITPGPTSRTQHIPSIASLQSPSNLPLSKSPAKLVEDGSLCQGALVKVNQFVVNNVTKKGQSTVMIIVISLEVVDGPQPEINMGPPPLQHQQLQPHPRAQAQSTRPPRAQAQSTSQARTHMQSMGQIRAYA